MISEQGVIDQRKAARDQRRVARDQQKVINGSINAISTQSHVHGEKSQVVRLGVSWMTITRLARKDAACEPSPPSVCETRQCEAARERDYYVKLASPPAAPPAAQPRI